MSLQVIGVGVGRTGTHSLKLALDRLGLGPCHHMEEVISNVAEQLPNWQAAVDGKPDWNAAYTGYESAVDWPTAAFWKELSEYYPEAKVILTLRSPESWYESFAETIFELLAGIDQAPPPMRPLVQMAIGVVNKTGFGGKSSKEDLMQAFTDHTARVTSEIPADRLLVFQVKDGWQPLCEFLGLPVPEEPFPRSNEKEQFWERIRNGGK